MNKMTDKTKEDLKYIKELLLSDLSLFYFFHTDGVYPVTPRHTLHAGIDHIGYSELLLFDNEEYAPPLLEVRGKNMVQAYEQLVKELEELTKSPDTRAFILVELQDPEELRDIVTGYKNVFQLMKMYSSKGMVITNPLDKNYYELYTPVTESEDTFHELSQLLSNKDYIEHDEER